MAIPFFEPRVTENSTPVDQVDGPSGSPTAPAITPAATSNTIDSNPPTANSEQLVAWKILALAMCKALKEYYLQSANAENAFTSGNGSLVQVLPNGQVQPTWK